MSAQAITLTHINMDLQQYEKLLVIFLTQCSFMTHAGFDSKESIYVNLLTSQNLQNVKLRAPDLPDNIQLWDLAVFAIWTMNHNGDKEDKEFDDTISWLAKTIGESKNSQYRQ